MRRPSVLRVLDRFTTREAVVASFRSQPIAFFCAGATVCFVTNLGEENPKEEKRIRVTQRFMRDGEPLGNQVTDDMFQAVRDETISEADMDYWFKEHPNDIEEESFLKPLEEVENTDFNVRNEVWESVRCLPLHIPLQISISILMKWAGSVVPVLVRDFALRQQLFASSGSGL